MKYPKIKTYAAASVLVAAGLSACGSDDDPAPQKVGGTADYVAANHELRGDFDENVTLEAGVDYKIYGAVNFLSGTTLTIPAGTTLYGVTENSYLAINRGATIDAQGTQAAPIIFTSEKDYTGNSSKDAKGEWGGVTLIGAAPIHGGEETYEAGTQVGGGNDPADSSGTMTYVMIKHSGFAVEVDKELNGLSLLAVGSGTKLENIAILGGADDGIEAWGGTVNLTNVYVYNAGDDSLDTDLGYTGTISNALVEQVITNATDFNSSGVESGNDKNQFASTFAQNPNPNATPLPEANPTFPTLKNSTLRTIAGSVYLKNDTGYLFDDVKFEQTNNTTDVDGLMAMVTHRNTDVVDDLSGNPWGIQIGTGGLVLDNKVNAELIFRKETAKAPPEGSTDATHAEAYWTANNDITAQAYAGNLFVSATTLNDGTTAVDANAAVSNAPANVGLDDETIFDWAKAELNK